MTKKIKMGVYVGSFDPFHKGHLATVKTALNYLDMVNIIPTEDYWGKKINSSVAERIKTINEYIRSTDIGNKVCLTLLREGQLDGYIGDPVKIGDGSTYDLLKHLTNLQTDYDHTLIMGADNLVSLHKWKHVVKLLKRYEVLIMPRNGIDVDKLIEEIKSKYKVKKLTRMDADEVNISSTEIRNKEKKQWHKN